MGKNVDLALLSECVEDFFKRKGFKTMKNESAEEYGISMIPQNRRDIRGGMSIRIFGDSNDFVMQLSASERTRSSIMLGFMTTMFGGGSLLRRGLKAREAFEKLESEFWVYAEETVARLVDSMEHRE